MGGTTGSLNGESQRVFTPSYWITRITGEAEIVIGELVIYPRGFVFMFNELVQRFPPKSNSALRLRPSNHATIQSIVHAIGIYSNVPAPCCIPDVMSSVTLLYFDEDRNVVLKNYPGMTVQSCACR